MYFVADVYVVFRPKCRSMIINCIAVKSCRFYYRITMVCIYLFNNLYICINFLSANNAIFLVS